MQYLLRTLKNPFDFKGRSTRKEFWLFFSLASVYQLASYLLFQSYLDQMKIFKSIGFEFLTLPIQMYFWLVYISLMTRRLHDIGKKDNHLLYILIPILGTIYLLYLFAQEGIEGENEFGEDPRNYFLSPLHN